MWKLLEENKFFLLEYIKTENLRGKVYNAFSFLLFKFYLKYLKNFIQLKLFTLDFVKMLHNKEFIKMF